MQIVDLPLISLTAMPTSEQLQHILNVRQRRRYVEARTKRAHIPKLDKLSKAQLQRLAKVLGLSSS